MPTFIIECEIPGAGTLTPQELADITAKSTQAVGRSGRRLMTGVVRAAASGAAVDTALLPGAGAAGAATLSRSQSDLAEVSRRPGTARPGKELDMFTTRSRRFVAAAAGLALAAGLATGCGSSSSERQATAVAVPADAVEERAQDHLAMDRALTQRLVRERPAAIEARDHLAIDRALTQRLVRERPAAIEAQDPLAMDRALTQRLIREHR